MQLDTTGKSRTFKNPIQSPSHDPLRATDACLGFRCDKKVGFTHASWFYGCLSPHTPKPHEDHQHVMDDVDCEPSLP